MSYFYLFIKCLTALGTKGKSLDAFDNEIKTYTAGISFSPFVASSPTDVLSLNETEGIKFSSHCLDRNLSKMLALIQENINSSNWDDSDRLKLLLSSVIYGYLMVINF